VLAMAPQTNIGSSTPINSSGGDIKGDLHRKVVNDAAASLRALTDGIRIGISTGEGVVNQPLPLAGKGAVANWH